MARSAYKIPLGGGPPKETSSTELDWLTGKKEPANKTTEQAKGTKNKTSDSDNATKQPQAKSKKPVSTGTRSVKIGKASPVRDMFLFAGFIGFMLFIAWVYSDVGQPVDITKEKPGSLASLKHYKKLMEKTLSKKKRNQIYRYDCGVFLTPSSIKGTGVGIFAGKNYSQGEEIVSAFYLVDY